MAVTKPRMSCFDVLRTHYQIVLAERETFLDDLDARTDERDRALSERDEAWRWRDAMQARINIR